MNLKDRLLAILDRFPTRNLVVIGDLIADQFLYGRISRVSREAPVLVLDYTDLVTLPGGAGNAANNLLDLGCRVRVVGAVGDDDEPGRELLAVLGKRGADLQHIARPASYKTPVKTRILAGAHHSSPQQIVRLDRVSDPLLRSLSRTALGSLVKSSDGIILSDYGYGMVQPDGVPFIAGLASKGNKPVVADSRFRLGDFAGITSMTPNITELETALGLSIDNQPELLARAGRQVLKKQKLKSLLVTQGRFGMTLFEPQRPPVRIPIFGTDEVADVTGAGDTVIAAYTLSLACGASPSEAARLANYAGGLVVMKRGTATVSGAELRSAIDQDLGS